MRFRRCAAAAAVALLAVLAASVGTAGAASCPWMNPALSPNARAEMLLGAMSLSDKVAMTYQQYPLDYHYGAAGYIPPNPSLCIPDLVFNDAGQGVGDAQTGTTAFPAPIAQSASWDPGLQYQFGAALGQEAWEKGIDVQLAPGIETDRVPMNGRNWEYASEDPFLSGQTGAAEVQGVQSQHVIVTLKHYIANSQETDRMTDSADVDQRTLEEMYAPQYDIAIHQGGAMGVMCSYNRINSVYSCQNPETLKGMLDSQFGFTGFVVSDWGATHSTVASALNGLDIEMNITPGTYFGPALETAVQDGQVPMSTLNDMVLRILRAMFTVGVFDHPPAAQPAAYAAPVSTPEHVALARMISEQGTVLLKNQDGILPLTGSGQRIALIGPAAGQTGAENEYNGEGSGHVPEAGIVPVVSPLQGITQRAAADGDTVLYADGTATADAVAAAKAASVAVVVVGRLRERGDRPLESHAHRRDVHPRRVRPADVRPERADLGGCGGEPEHDRRARHRRAGADAVARPDQGADGGVVPGPGGRERAGGAAVRRRRHLRPPARDVPGFGDGDADQHRRAMAGRHRTRRQRRAALDLQRGAARRLPLVPGQGRHAAVPVRLRALVHDVPVLGSDGDADLERSRGSLHPPEHRVTLRGRRRPGVRGDAGLDGRASPATEGVPEGVARARTQQDGLDPSPRDLVRSLGHYLRPVGRHPG